MKRHAMVSLTNVIQCIEESARSRPSDAGSRKARYRRSHMGEKMGTDPRTTYNTMTAGNRPSTELEQTGLEKELPTAASGERHDLDLFARLQPQQSPFAFGLSVYRRQYCKNP
jgi:hypothetical protein